MNLKHEIRSTKSESGFTLVETLVAVSILTVAIAGPLYTAERAAAAAYAARDLLTASYLAQEAIEYVRAMRDDTYLAAYRDNPGVDNLSAIAWSNFITGDKNTDQTLGINVCRNTTCLFDPALPMGASDDQTEDTALWKCSGLSCTPLYLTGGIYSETQTSGLKTSFVRTISINDYDTACAILGGDDPVCEEQLVVKVVWYTDGVYHSLTMGDNLTSWQ